jgi:beta-glucosidase
MVIDGDANEPNPAQSNNSFWGEQLGDAVRNGTIPESRLDDMVCFLAFKKCKWTPTDGWNGCLQITRLLAAYYKLGQDKNFPPVKCAPSS